MLIFTCILALLTGCGVFMTGMKLLSDGLEKSAGEGMKSLFKKVGVNPFINMGVGALFTAIVESSAATTVMTIGFVNAGAMTLLQATYVIMGANIGTTVTGVIVSFASFNVETYAALLSFVGVMLMFIKSDKCKKIGQILSGFGLVFVGLGLMKGAFNEPSVRETFAHVFETINFPLLLVFIGIVFTALIQSSTTTTGLLIIMVSGGAITLQSALFIILGANIGTCMTAFLASAGTNVNARRTAVIHLLFNVTGGVLFFIIVLFVGDPLCSLLAAIFDKPGMQLAWFHVLFNVTTSLLILPFAKVLTKLATRIVKEKKTEDGKLQLKYLDERLLRTPPIAVAQVKKEVVYMANLAKENVERAFTDFINGTNDNAQKILDTEAIIDFTNNEVTKYLIRLSPLVSGKDEKVIGSFFHVVNDIERIGDHAENFLDINVGMGKEEVEFSQKARQEIIGMYDVIRQMFDIALEVFDDKNEDKLTEMSELENTIDALKDSLSARHVKRMANGECRPELGAYFYSEISGLERVADHLVNIAYSIINPTGSESLS